MQMIVVVILSWVLTFACVRHVFLQVQNKHLRQRSTTYHSRKYLPSSLEGFGEFEKSLEIHTEGQGTEADDIEYVISTSDLDGKPVTYNLPKAVHPKENTLWPLNEFLTDNAEMLADFHKNIILIPVDFDELDIAINFYEFTLHKSGISNYIFLLSNKKHFNIIRSMGINAFYYSSKFAIDVDLHRKHDHFKRKTYFSAIYELLIRKYRVYVVSPYAVIFRNVFSMRTDYMGAITIPKLPYISTDFMLLLPQSDTIEIIKEAFLQLAERNIVLREESNAVLAKVIQEKTAFGNVTVGYFPVIFNTGKVVQAQVRNTGKLDVWYEDSSGATRHSHCERCYGLLDARLSSKQATKYLYRESLFWLVDRDGYYSNRGERYLMFNNLQTEAASLESQLKVLKDALAIGMMLGRKVILPDFTCNGCSHPFCKTSKYCLLSAHIDFVSFHKVFSEWFKESTFFHHPKLHKDIRTPPVQAVVLTNGTNRTISKNDSITIQPAEGRSVITTEDIQRSLLHIDNPVLHFKFHPGIIIEFPESQQSVFEDMIQRAFVYLHHQQ